MALVVFAALLVPRNATAADAGDWQFHEIHAGEVTTYLVDHRNLSFACIPRRGMEMRLTADGLDFFGFPGAEGAKVRLGIVTAGGGASAGSSYTIIGQIVGRHNEQVVDNDASLPIIVAKLADSDDVILTSDALEGASAHNTSIIHRSITVPLKSGKEALQQFVQACKLKTK